MRPLYLLPTVCMQPVRQRPGCRESGAPFLLVLVTVRRTSHRLSGYASAPVRASAIIQGRACCLRANRF